MHAWRIGSGLLLAASMARGETGCFRTVAGAAAGAGGRDEEGYRVKGVRRDELSGLLWARIGRCGHPEWPAVLVRVGAEPAHAIAEAISVTKRQEEIVVHAGARVRLVQTERWVRLEMAGIAEASGRVGDAITVRLLRDGGDARVVGGLVKGADLVEMER